jgi:hypothetical protein
MTALTETARFCYDFDGEKPLWVHTILPKYIYILDDKNLYDVFRFIFSSSYFLDSQSWKIPKKSNYLEKKIGFKCEWLKLHIDHEWEKMLDL